MLITDFKVPQQCALRYKTWLLARIFIKKKIQCRFIEDYKEKIHV